LTAWPIAVRGGALPQKGKRSGLIRTSERKIRNEFLRRSAEWQSLWMGNRQQDHPDKHECGDDERISRSFREDMQ
jgi:hypothetical protein